MINIVHKKMYNSPDHANSGLTTNKQCGCQNMERIHTELKLPGEYN